MWCCPSSTAACSPAPSPSRTRCRKTTRFASPRFASRPEPDRVAMVADRIEALVRLKETPRAKRRVAVLMPDYPAAGGRAGYAVGLDVPQSVVALLADLAEAGYAVAEAPRAPSALLEALEAGASEPGDFAARLPAPSRRAPRRHFEPHRGRLGRARRRPRLPRRRLQVPRRPVRQCAGRASARARARERPARDLSRSQACRRAMPCSPSGFGCATKQGRRDRAYGRARHARMAAGEGRGADRAPASPRPWSGRCP